MKCRKRLPVVLLTAALWACSGTGPNTLGPENCTNHQDDNGDGKTDCADPKCFQDPACTGQAEICDNHLDDNGDGKIDCADPLCDGMACGGGCTCVNGGPGGSGGSGGSAGGSGGSAGSGGAGGSGGSAGSGGAGGSGGTGGSAGSGGSGASGGAGGSAGSGGTGASSGGSGGSGGSAGGGTGTEICNDLLDNDSDRAIDCADSKCFASPLCIGVQDGLPCASDGQCAGGTCLTEAIYGVPNGVCTNSVSCTVTGNVGCHGGLCSVTSNAALNRCRPPCVGTGTGSTGRCRAGFTCFNPDSSTSNNNNYCIALCSNDSECAGTGTGYGCNAWSKLCENKDYGQGRYGAACTTAAQCESGFCFTGPDFPGGYCSGVCRGDTLNCAPGGSCKVNAAYGDNLGLCFQSCSGTSQCRSLENYTCWGPAPATCGCLVTGSACFFNSDCCSGSCNIYSTCD